MKVLLSGATGAQGTPLVADVMDREGLLRAVKGFQAGALRDF
jgi:hypothetical protein